MKKKLFKGKGIKTMKKTFKKICRMSQKSVKKYAVECLSETHDKVIAEDGFVYAEGKFPVLLVAHMDTVHKSLVKKVIDKDGIISSPNGIGGDDRCGIYMILQIVKQINCSVLFCEDEEIGGIGATKFTETKLAEELEEKFNYLIEFDRRGDKDAVFYECDNKDFEDFITKDFYKKAYGSYSDICTVAPVLKAAAVNLSCGYYKAHTTDEYVVWDEMQRSIAKAIKILNRTTEKDKFEYIPAPISINDYMGYGYGSGFYEDYYNYGYGENYYEITYLNAKDEYKTYDTLASSELEAIGMFCVEHSDLTYSHILSVECLDEMM